MDTEQIVYLLKNRKQIGLKYLIDAYSAALYGIIMRILTNKETSEEALQETFLKIWESIDQYDSDKAMLFTWMSRIARNTALDKKRMKNYTFINQEEPLNEDTMPSVGIPPMTTATIDIEKLTNSIEPKYQEVLNLVYLQGYTHSEAAEALNIPIGTIKTRLRKAIMILREIIEDEKTLLLGSVTITILILMSLLS